MIRAEARAQFLASCLAIAEQSDSERTTVITRDAAGNVVIAAVLAFDEAAARLIEFSEQEDEVDDAN